MSEHKCPRRAESFGVFKLPEGDTWRPDRTCSYCGSLSPEAFFEAVDAGHQIDPTDKSYKVYVNLPDRHGKFYFQHLSEDDKQRFIDLANAGKLKLGYPGHFYVTPFFCQKVAAGA